MSDFDCGNCGDCGGDCADCGDCSGDCGCGDCKDCVNDCCDCNNLDCDIDRGTCTQICQQCFSGPMANESRIRRFIAALISLFLVVAQWLTSLNNFSAYTNNKYTINNLQTMLNYGPINEIGLYQECPANTILFTNYSFPSTIQGCYNQVQKTLINQTCNIYSLETVTLGTQSKVDTTYWGYSKSQLPYKLCGKRTNITYQYLKTQKVNSSSDCAVLDLKLCQDEAKDDNFYCVNKKEQCPIRNIKFDTTITENYEKVDQAVIEDQYLLVTRNFSTFQYLMNFNITRGLGICLDRDELASGDGQDYPLNNPQWTNCDLDGSYSTFLILTTQAFIDINGLSEIFQSTRPLYNQTSNITLFFQKSINTVNVLEFSALFDDFERSISYLIYIISLSLAYWLYIVVIIINEIGRCIFNWAEYLGPHGKQCVTVLLFYVFRIMIQVPLIVLTQYGFFTMKTCQKTIDTLARTLIMDKYSANMLDFSKSIQVSVMQQYTALQGLVFAQLAIDLVVAIWAYYSDKKKKKQKKYQQYQLPAMVAMTYLAQSHDIDRRN